MLQRKILVGLAVAGFAFTTTMAVLHPMRTVTPPPDVTVQHVQFTQAECEELGRAINEMIALQNQIDESHRETVIAAAAWRFGLPGALTARLVLLTNHATRLTARSDRQWIEEYREDCPDTPVSP